MSEHHKAHVFRFPAALFTAALISGLAAIVSLVPVCVMKLAKFTGAHPRPAFECSQEVGQVSVTQSLGNFR